MTESTINKLVLATATALVLAVVARAEPNIAKWEANMLQYGATHCAAIPTPPYPTDAFGMTYYDMGRVYYQMFDYTGDSKWISCAKSAVELYREQYVIPNGGKASGYWNFSDGLLREGSPRSLEALSLLSTSAAFADITTGWGATGALDPSYSREIAYSTLLWLNVKAANLPTFSQAKMDAVMAAMDKHVTAWLTSGTAQPFMVGLTAEALLRAKGEAATPQIKALADMLKPKWTGKSFPYLNNDGTTGEAPDLNLLIAPAFAWMCKYDPAYCAIADEIFNAGVAYAYLGGPKQFNQNYRWSFDFVKWRTAAVPTPTATPTRTATPTATPTPKQTPWTITCPAAGAKMTLTWK